MTHPTSERGGERVDGRGAPRHPRARRWMLALGAVVLLAGHAIPVRSAASHLAVSGTMAGTIVSGMAVLVLVKHLGLFAALRHRLRRRHGR